MQRLVFAGAPRGLPNLGRGWRTPDPSPSRSAAGLPSCSAHVFDYELNDDAPEVVDNKYQFEFSPVARGRSQQKASHLVPLCDFGTHPLLSSMATASMELRSRTPSPTPIMHALAPVLPMKKASSPQREESNEDEETLTQCDTPRDRPSVEESFPDMQWTSEDPLQDMHDQHRIWATPPAQLGQFGITPETMRAHQVHVPNVPQMPPRFQATPPCQLLPEAKPAPVKEPFKLSITNLLITGGAMQFQGPPPPLAADWSTEEADAPDKPVVSMGSVGHPLLCKMACKYAMKKRGCKEGINCDRCHLCSWKTKGQPQQGQPSRGAQEQGSLTTTTVAATGAPQQPQQLWLPR